MTAAAPWNGWPQRGEGPRTNQGARPLLRAGLGLGLLVGTWYALKNPAVQRADVRVGDAMRAAGGRRLDFVVTHTTDLGSMYAVLGIAAALAATGRRRTAADALAVGLAAWNIGQHAKRRVRRQRPYESEGVRRLIRPPTGSSFPSGHAAVGAAVFAVLADRSRSSRTALLLHAVGAYVAASRVYAGVHYPTDVIGGAGTGLAIGAAWRGPLAAAGRLLVRAAVRLPQRR